MAVPPVHLPIGVDEPGRLQDPDERVAGAVDVADRDDPTRERLACGRRAVPRARRGHEKGAGERSQRSSEDERMAHHIAVPALHIRHT